MTHQEIVRQAALEIFEDFVDNPPAHYVIDSRFGYEWTPEGYDHLIVLIDALQFATGEYMVGRKTHAYDYEPYCFMPMWFSDDDSCSGGCCDDRYPYKSPPPPSF